MGNTEDQGFINLDQGFVNLECVQIVANVLFKG